jgi:hypothetical protein
MFDGNFVKEFTIGEKQNTIFIKGFDKDLQCRYMQYEVGKTYILDETEEKLEIGEWGFHFTDNIATLWGQYGKQDNRYCIVTPAGDVIQEDRNFVTNKIKIEKEITRTQLIDMFVNKHDDEHDYQLLAIACWHDDVDLFHYMLSKGVNVNATNIDGKTALMFACYGGKCKWPKLLIENGADVNAVNHFGETPLSDACFRDNLKIVKLLLDNRADVNITNKCGYTALDKAKITGEITGDKEIIDLLKAKIKEN